MLITVLLLAVGAVALWLAIAATRPDQFQVTRNAVIKAPAPKIFALIDDLRSFNNSGATRGVGAAYAWQGRKVGAGRMEITASQAPHKLTMRLDFVKPFKAQNTAEFTLLPHGDALTVVSWTLRGPSPYLSRLIGVVIDMDAMIGKDFEAGLANLKALTEGR
jgi:hypothetical protein